MKQRYGVIGVTGFVGRYVARALASRGYDVVGFSRSGVGRVPEVCEWRRSGAWDFSSLDGLINLSGERVDQRWTEKNKRKFEASRIGVTQEIVATLQSMSDHDRPKVWVNASAVGFYGDRADEICTEGSPPGTGYLAQLCLDWEAATKGIEETGVRCVMVRIGMVLGRGGMAWDRLRLAFAWGGGAQLGSGRQWMPWIHVDDLTAGIIWSIEQNSISGVVNGVATEPVTNRDFTRQLARALRRPAPWIAPGWVLRGIFGEFGSFLTSSQRVAPKRWIDAGFVFRYPTLDLALAELLQKP
ncbi:MAG: TIGR01777 family protein [Verrucomicrobia bacterium]|nr:MAG: TIGR01777 family protein [Verrucomicrobiota bacterium]